MAAHVKSAYPPVQIPESLTVPAYVLAEAATRHGHKPAFIDATSGQHMSYTALVNGVRRLASGLFRRLQRHPVTDGEDGGRVCPRRPVVCVFANRCLEYPMVVHAVLLIGGSVTTIDPTVATDDLSRHFEILMPDFIIADFDKVDDARFAASRFGTVKEIFVLGKFLRGHVSIEELLRDDGRAPIDDVTINCIDDVTIVPFAADSRGNPTAAMHSHHSFNANVAILSCPDISPVSRDDVVFCCHQMSSMVGLTVYCGVLLKEGATAVILPDYSHRGMLEAVGKHKVTVLHATPAATDFIASDPKVTRSALSSVRRVYVSGAPLREGVIGEVMGRSPEVTEVREGLGTPGAAAILAVARGETLPGYVGTACPNTEIQIRDILFGGVVETETFGEICVRGPQVMLGSLCKSDSESDQVEDGWLHTGHIGQLEENGYFSLLGKTDDLINYDSFQIAPIELEKIVRQHPDVDDVTVIAMDNNDFGHVPRAYVIKKPGADVIEGEIYDFVADQVPNHKKLRGGVVFVNDVPRSVLGEPQRFKLQAEARRAADDLDISLGEGAQWPPDRTYLEDMRKLTRKDRNERASSNSSKWDQMLGADSFGDFPSISIGSMGGEVFQNASEIFSHSPVKFDDALDGFVTTRNKDEVKENVESKGILTRERGKTKVKEEDLGTQRSEGIELQMNDNNNDENVGGTTPLKEESHETKEHKTIHKAVHVSPIVSELTVDCHAPISTSTPKHSPRHYQPHRRSHSPPTSTPSSRVSRPARHLPFDLSDPSTEVEITGGGDTPSTLTPQITHTGHSEEVVEGSHQSDGGNEVFTKEENSDSGMEDSPRREYFRGKKTSLEEAMNLDSSGEKSSMKGTHESSMSTRRNLRGLGGASWKSTGDLISSNASKFGTTGDISLDDSSPKVPPNASFQADDRWKAAANIRHRANMYSLQVRQREQDRRAAGSSLRSPLGISISGSPLGPRDSYSKPSSFSSTSSRYGYSPSSRSPQSSYSSNRAYLSFSLTRKYDLV